MQLSLEELCAILGVEAQGSKKEQVQVTQAAYDSRLVKTNSLFVAIKGEQVDGHDYAVDAKAKGASVLLVERYLPGIELPQLVVKNSIQALGQIAKEFRARTKAKVIAVTGTSGKTTVKQALASVLSQVGKTQASLGNLNTQIGLPCSILNASGEEDFWVMECGISHVGDMEALGSILRPNLALILNVGPGHTEGLGDLGVAWHKTRLLMHLAEDGEAVVSADYPDLVWKALGCHLEHLTFFSAKPGVEGSSSYLGSYLGPVDATHGRYLLRLPENHLEVVAPFVGEYGAENCIAVACCAKLLGVADTSIQKGLELLELPKQRFNVIKAGSWQIIDDTYNANPLSMQRMLEAAYDPKKPLVAVLGEMRELGSESAQFHKSLGESLGRLKPKAIFWKGGFWAEVEAGLKASQYQGKLLVLNSLTQFAKDLKELELASWEGGTVIFKGSRANALEQYVPVLKNIWITEE
ncbi:MAG: UDP-N-acetylmuramoyl-tripeptide--D-alanyl-D-alanine ligase [Desulfovibrionaceae bacterium]|nr:UDP-N-acetylmuramoyl-tripeptide--D-alanyl-D-alanine ligase [Desulfovibrionaceae bacterium]